MRKSKTSLQEKIQNTYKRHIEKRCKVKSQKEEEERKMIESLKKDKAMLMEQHEKEKKTRFRVQNLVKKDGFCGDGSERIECL